MSNPARRGSSYTCRAVIIIKRSKTHILISLLGREGKGEGEGRKGRRSGVGGRGVEWGGEVGGRGMRE